MEQMSLLDATFLYLENDVTPMHIGGVAIFEGPPATHDELVGRFAAKMHLVPRYRQRVKFLPLDIGRPAWIDDEHFSLEYHLRRTAVPAPGGRAELDNLVGRVMSQHLDRARPLWEIWAVEGLDDGQWAIISKVHHCMVDGVSSVDLMAVLFDAEQHPAAAPPAPPWHPRPTPTPAEMLTSSLAGLVSPVEGVRRVAGALRSPRALLDTGVETARAIAGLAPKLLPPPATTLNGSYGPHRRWTSAHATLADVKAVRAALGGTINDVVLTAITRGFRDLLLGRGESVTGRTVRTMVPVSVRAENEKGAFNNKVSAVFADLPVGLADPVARLASIRAAMDGIKKSKGAVAGARLAELGDFAPPMLLAAGQRLATTVRQTSFHTVTTNVPGPQRPLYFAGRRLLESAPTIPLAASIRTAVGIFSDGGVHFGLTGDYDTVSDLAVLARGIEAGVAELVALAAARSPQTNGARQPGRTDMTMPEVTLPETVAALPAFAAERFADRPAQRFHRDGEWRDTSFTELRDAARGIGLGLVDLGVAPGDRVAVLADTRPEWLQVELGIALAGAVVVPIYPSSSADECEWVLGNSGAVAVVCENAAQLAKVEQVRERLPALRDVVLVDGDGGTSLADLRARSGDLAELDRRSAAVAPDDPGLIIYTSGTTGRPKGCVLTHRNLTSCCRVVDELGVLAADDVVYLFLPLAHVFAQVIALGSAGSGAVVGYCSGGAAAIMPDLQALSPTVVPSVPRIFEKVYAMVSGLVPAEMRAQAVAAGLAVHRLERAGQPVPDELRAGFERADGLLFSRVRAAFGGALRQAITGAAPIAPEILEFFHSAGVPVNEGYGLSESTAIGTINTAAALRIGTVGRPVPECEVRIAEDGEILMAGPHIFAGYWGNPEATAEILVDGWLQTGDLGALDPDGFLSITGRKKDIIITAGGKNLSPANLENDLRGSRWISQAVMHGDRRPYPVALITLDPDELAPWARAQDLPADIPSLAANPAVRTLIQEALDDVNARYARVEQIKKFAILDHDLSVETGELTPTLKVKRRVVEEKYADLLDGLYTAST